MSRISQVRAVLSVIYNRPRITRIYRDLRGLFVACVEDNDVAIEITEKKIIRQESMLPCDEPFFGNPSVKGGA